MDSAPDHQTILIVDDNPTNLGVIVDYLEAHDYRIIIARDGETALKRAQIVQPDIILLDVMMPPGIDGFETCRRLKANEDTCEIPVIFMTALARTEDKVEGFNVGAVDYVTKPIQQEEVLARVTTHLTLQSQNKQLAEMTAELRTLNAELTALNASKDKFFTVLAHDLRSPFNGLVGNAQLLYLDAENLSAEEVATMASDMYDAANVTHNLLENLLAWAGQQQGQMNYAPETTSLNALVKRTLCLHNSAAQAKNITLVNKLATDFSVFVDVNMIELVLRNLINNGIKFTPEGGQVSVAAYQQGEGDVARVYVSVTDSGVGIPPLMQDKLFNLNENYTTEGTNKEKGSGLGLILCQDLLAMHGGKLSIKSSTSQGTTMQFSVLTVPSGDLELENQPPVPSECPIV